MFNIFRNEGSGCQGDRRPAPGEQPVAEIDTLQQTMIQEIGLLQQKGLEEASSTVSLHSTVSSRERGATASLPKKTWPPHQKRGTTSLPEQTLPRHVYARFGVKDLAVQALKAVTFGSDR